ncbi:MAG: hypothetical protein AB1413_05815 [Thermodesulfobacteriota bacterium]
MQRRSLFGHTQIINLIFVIYWLLIFEGALRKWVAPQFEEVLFFIRVPLTLVLYAVVFAGRQWPKANGPLLSAYLLAAAGAGLACAQLVVGDYDFRYMLLAGYGWLNYFFYIPLAFIIADRFSRDDVGRLVRHTLWIAVAAAPLVVAQYDKPAHAFINQGFGVNDEQLFYNLGSGYGMVRPFGFFSSTLGQQMFVASVMALVLALWLTPQKSRPVGGSLLLAGTLAGLVMLILSQSRGLFFNVGAMLLAAFVGGWVAGKQRILFRVVFLSATASCFGLVLWLFVFPEAFDAFSERVFGAWGVETYSFQFGIFGRAFYALYSFVDYLTDTPLIGHLLGLGGNAARQLSWVVLPQSAYHWMGPSGWGEEGWERHIIELGPLVGLVYIIFRLGLIVWLGRLVMRATRRSNDPMPVVLFGYVGTALLALQITGHGTVNGYTWMFFGFCLAAARLGCDHAGATPIHPRCVP